MESVYIDKDTGYAVSEQLKKVKDIEFEIYKEFLRVCEKYKLKFFAAYGSMLGAVRHGDMIPWDDDMDFIMLREDYEKLCSVAEQEFNGKYFFQTGINDPNYFFGYARLRDLNTTGIISWFSNHPHKEGIFIDIFVYDKAPEDINLVKKQMKKIRRLHFLLNNYYHINTIGWKKIALFLPLKLVKYFITYEKLYIKYKETCLKYSANKAKKYYLAASPCLYECNWVDENEISELNKVKFGDTYTFIPKGYAQILTRIYGNYMELPPVIERGNWHNNIITFDPDVSYREYELNHPERFKRLNREYLKLEQNK